VTHLRQLMLDELQRRNYSQALSVATSTRWRIFRSTSIVRLSALVPAIFASTRCICFVIGSCRPGPSRAVLRPCGFCSSRPFGDPICR